MANYTIFGTANPTGMSYDGASTTALDLFTAFYMTSGSGYQITGARVWLDPTGDNGSGYIAYLWQGKDITAASPIASVSFPSPMALGGWNTATFATPVAITPGTFYWISVHFPNGRYSYKPNVFDTAYGSADLANLYGAGFGEVTPTNGAYNLSGTAGAPPTGGSTSHPWYGVDVVIADGGTPAGTVTGSDSVAVSDAVTAVRGGLATSVDIQGSAADPLGSTANAAATVSVSGSTQHSFGVSMMGNRIFTGSPIGRETGPTLNSTADSSAEIGVEFQVKRNVNITGARIYKHPQAGGTIPVTLWDETGTALATKTVSWVADGGGWRTVLFDTPVPMAPGSKYRFSYFAANGYFPASAWYYNAQEMYEPPFWVGDPSVGPAANVYTYSNTSTYPTTHGNAACYWIDVLGTVDQTLPAAADGFMGQWSNYQPKNAFPVGVYYPDPPYVAGYYDIGVNTIVNVPVGQPGYRDAILSRNVDVWAAGDPSWVVSDPELAAHVQGYVLGDEPDMAPTWVDAQTLRNWVTNIRKQDSSRPLFLNFGTAAALTEGWSFLIPGLSLTDHITKVLDQIGVADIVSCDYYNLEPKASSGFGGVWTYFAQVRRMRQFSDGLKPVWAIVETTSQEPGYPVPDDVEKAVWATLIAGAKGIIFFDHRFGDALNTQDFAAMLSDSAMKAKVTSISSKLQTLAAPLKADEAGLVTAVSSSNTSSGPLGGTFGVPIEYSSRQAGGVNYLFTMSARPGTTTGTLTVPSAAGKTLTRIGPGESGTLTVGSDGVITQDYASNYEIHLYQWTP